MRALEKTLWSLFKSNLDKHYGASVHVQRIETGLTGRGIPDVNIAYKGTLGGVVMAGELWVELKMVDGLRVKLEPEQAAWHMRRVAAGGRTWILAREKKEGPRVGNVDNIHIWPGEQAVDVLNEGLHCSPLVTFAKPFDWPALFYSLGLPPVGVRKYGHHPQSTMGPV
jgi:hypothetical protein